MLSSLVKRSIAFWLCLHLVALQYSIPLSKILGRTAANNSASPLKINHIYMTPSSTEKSPSSTEKSPKFSNPTRATILLLNTMVSPPSISTYRMNASSTIRPMATPLQLPSDVPLIHHVNSTEEKGFRLGGAGRAGCGSCQLGPHSGAYRDISASGNMWWKVMIVGLAGMVFVQGLA